MSEREVLNMLNFLINFCIITFICYAVSGPVKAILFPKKRRPARRAQKRVAASRVERTQQRRKAKIIVISRKRAVRSNLRAA